MSDNGVKCISAAFVTAAAIVAMAICATRGGAQAREAALYAGFASLSSGVIWLLAIFEKLPTRKNKP